MPVFGYCLKLAEYIPVDRSRSVSGAQESVAAARRILAEGIHITTFVEGTRSKDGRMLPFKKGPFYLAMETGAPCIPISIYGTETLLAKAALPSNRAPSISSFIHRSTGELRLPRRPDAGRPCLHCLWSARMDAYLT